MPNRPMVGFSQTVDFVEDPRATARPASHLRLGPQRQMEISWPAERNTLVRGVHMTPCEGLYARLYLATPGHPRHELTLDWLIPEVLNLGELAQPLAIGQQLVFTLQNRTDAPMTFCIAVKHSQVGP